MRAQLVESTIRRFRLSYATRSTAREVTWCARIHSGAESILRVRHRGGDEKQLQTERRTLEQIKNEALMRMLTQIKSSTSVSAALIADIKRRFDESQAELTRLRVDRAITAGDAEEMRAKLQPLDFTRDVNSELKKYMHGTRLTLLAKVKEWMDTPSSRPAARDHTTSRVFWLKGDPGIGKTCLSSVICDTFAQSILGVHFCRHDMDTRKDARRMVRSLAYQIAPSA
jgi:hypothetical protein